jgi:hypothetical protein
VSCWLYQHDQRTCCLDAKFLSVGRTFIRKSQPLAQDLLKRKCLEPCQIASQCGCSLTITTSLPTSPPPRPPFTFHIHLIPHVPHDRQNHGSQREHRYPAQLFFRSRANKATASFCPYKQRILPPSYTPHTTSLGLLYISRLEERLTSSGRIAGYRLDASHRTSLGGARLTVLGRRVPIGFFIDASGLPEH